MSINWGFIGAGMVAEKALAPAVKAAGNANLYAVASRDKKRALALKPEVAYDNYEELLNDPKVDAIYLCLPNNLHKSLGLAALNAGKHLLCEKPLAISYLEGQELFDLAEKKNLLAVEAIWFRWHPRSIKAFKAAAFEIGALEEIKAAFTFKNNTVGNYRFDPAQGGGALFDLGPYPLHLITALVGVNSKIKLTQVSQKIGASGVDLSTTVTGVIDDLINFNFHLSFDEAEFQEVLITGSDGVISYPKGAPFSNWNEASQLKINQERFYFEALDPYKLMIEAVSTAISTGANTANIWLPSEAESLFVMRLLDQIRQEAVVS